MIRLAAAVFLLALPLAASAEDDGSIGSPTDQPFNGRQNVEQFWQSKGVSKEVSQGIADRVMRESGGDPTKVNPNDNGSPSAGLYQHHGQRLQVLLAAVENDQAFQEATKTDPIASRHWAEIKNAPDRATAAKLWDRYFERSAASQSRGGTETNVSVQKTIGRDGKSRPAHIRATATGIQTPAPARPVTCNSGTSMPEICFHHPEWISAPQLASAPAGATGVCAYLRSKGNVPPMCRAAGATQQTAVSTTYTAPTITSPPRVPVPTYRLPQTGAVLALASFFHRRR